MPIKNGGYMVAAIGVMASFVTLLISEIWCKLSKSSGFYHCQSNYNGGQSGILEYSSDHWLIKYKFHDRNLQRIRHIGAAIIAFLSIRCLYKRVCGSGLCKNYTGNKVPGLKLCCSLQDM